MSGRVIRLLSRTDFDYSGLGASAASGEIPIAIDVDISGSRETTLLVRTHAREVTGAAGKYEIITRASAPTAEDPNNYFRDATALSTTTIAVTGGSPPFLTRIVIPANAGAWLSVFLKATQGGTGGQNVKGTFSVDASLKD